MTTTGPSAPTELLSAIIVGAGFAGLGMGIALRKQGIRDFVILEKAHDVGGVWRDNSYPGAACDVPSHLYSFSFELSPNWSRTYSPQSEIYEYLRHCARKYELLPHIQFSTEVSEAHFDDNTAVWTITLRNGTQLRSRLFIVGTGQLSRLAYPRISGIEDFKGVSFHSARWDHNYSLEGKRIAVIGTGASAIQFVPAIADRVNHLKVFQRSAAYVIPRHDYAYSPTVKSAFKVAPWLMKLYRLCIYLHHDIRKPAFTNRQWLMKYMAEKPFRKLLARDIKDPSLAQRLTPDYPVGCKRILISSNYLATFAKPHVELVTQEIRRITTDGVETSDGTHHPADAIIYGTGFTNTEFLAPMRVTGSGGLDLNVAWKDGAKAYLGITVPKFPNLFILYGPNTNLGHNSIVYMLESQFAHIMRCIKTMRARHCDTIEVTTEAHDKFDTKVQNRLKRAVWSRCESNYIDVSGRNTTIWPGFSTHYRIMTRRSLDAYQFRQSPEGTAGTP